MELDMAGGKCCGAMEPSMGLVSHIKFPNRVALTAKKIQPDCYDIISDNEFYYTLGDKYFGQWENGYQEGLGTFYSQTGVYVGDWSCGLQNGKAHVFLNNGNK